jgi:8-oxo-dGTP pyrophosphatase MutT (NUDIX family)
MPSKRSIRVGAAGIIVQDDKVLVVKFDDENGPHYNYPGGGHQEGETLRRTAVREVKEETDADVEVGQLRVVAESAPFEVEYAYGSTHFSKFFFECTLIPVSVPKLPEKPDPNETAVEWQPIDRQPENPIIPDIVEPLLNALQGNEVVYVEDKAELTKRINKR